MLGAGHIGEYLLHHCNLYKHSQQGWEAFNALLKTFFPIEQAGEGRGIKELGKKSKIIPIARWLSCCMLWMMGYDYNHVLEELHNVLHDDCAINSADDSGTDSNIVSGYESNNSGDDAEDNII